MPAFEMNGIKVAANGAGRREKPGVNHGAAGAFQTAAVPDVNAAKTNTARIDSTEAMTMGTAATRGVADVVRRMLLERSIDGTVTADADLREIGLTSLDMVDLVLSVECAFDLQIPEAQITPANFRSIAAIDALVNNLRS
jgi:acyl carrier protein